MPRSRFVPLLLLFALASSLASGPLPSHAAVAPPNGFETEPGLVREPLAAPVSPWSEPAATLEQTAVADGDWSSIGGASIPLGPPRLTHDAIYDPVRKRMIVFGGSTGPSFSNEVWALDTEARTWTMLSPSGTPPAGRRLHSTVYDPVRDRLIVVGGYDGTFYSDVWALSLAGAPSWSLLSPAGPAFPARGGHATVYDPAGDRVVVFGGYDGVSPPSNRRNDVWALSLSGTPTWSNITPALPGPSARSSMSGVYDSANQRMVIFGGTTPTFQNDVWALSLTGAPAWSPITPVGSTPPAREEHVAVFDPLNNRMVIHGGLDASFLYGDTWSLSLSGPPTWTLHPPCGFSTGGIWGHAAVYDSDHGQMLVHGGYNGVQYLPTTLALGLGPDPEWIPYGLGGGAGPNRHTFAFAYDPSRHVMWLFGGSDGNCYQNDVYRLSLGPAPAWQLINPAGTPPSARRLTRSIYDPVRDRLIVFGGYDGTFYNDTWELSLSGTPTWSQLAPGGPLPPPRSGHGMIYDPSGDRVIVYGGFDGVTPPANRLGDVWALSLGGTPQWSQITPAGPGPGARSSHAVAYDPAGARMLMFGGTNPAFQNDAWQLTLTGTPAWTQIPAGNLPPEREESSLILDPARNRLVMYGGYGSFYLYGDLWELPLTGTPTWQPLSPTGDGPGARWGHSAAYDPLQDRMVLHGGQYRGNTTWFLSWSLPTATQASVVEAVGERGTVRLEWELRGSSTAVRLERQGPAGWTERATLTPDGRGRVRFVDREVSAGGRYEYRLVDRGSSEVLSQVTVDVPAGGFELRSATYQEGRLVIDCSIPGTEELSIELLDASGRRAHQMTWSAGRAGDHQIEMRVPALASGVYFARIRQAGLSKTRPVALVR